MRQGCAAIFIAAAATLCATLLTGAGAEAAVRPASAGARAGTRGGQLPGSAAPGAAWIDSVSCASAGNCTAGGHSLDDQAFVVTEKNGIWGKPTVVRGLAGLEMGGGAQIDSVSCSSAGTCSAGGSYMGAHGGTAFIVDEKHGAWGSAGQVPGLARLSKTGDDGIDSVSCTPAGACTAAGTYDEQSTLEQGLVFELAFVVTEKHGTWGTARAVPGLAALDTSGYAAVTSLSCGSAGTCSAGGFYNFFKGGGQGFVVTERHGTWGRAEPVPGLARLGPLASGIRSVSCGSAGTCSAGGSYQSRDGSVQAFVIGEQHGTWGTARAVSGLAALNTGGLAGIDSLSCGSSGNCSAGGSYVRRDGDEQAFVVTEQHGTWGSAEPVRIAAAISNKSGYAEIFSLSCASAGNCSAGGQYLGRDGVEAFVVNEKSGTWGSAEQVPGLARLNTGGGAQIQSLSCGSAGNCSASGFYSVGSYTYGFVVTERHGTWGAARTFTTRGAPL
jgi:hypothetical protein